jgi:proline iminopeptidase
MPILIIAGRYPAVAVPQMQVKYKQYCHQAQFILFEKSGHNPEVEEQTKDFKILKEFLLK